VNVDQLHDFLMAGNDLLDGRFAPRAVTLDGGLGNDRIRGSAHDDELYGGEGNDKINGNWGNDRASGGDGEDVLLGSAGFDILRGDTGADILAGGYGQDVLFGGAGSDSISGGHGMDIAVFTGSFAKADIQRSSSGLTVASRNGTDTLQSVERLAFDDGIYAWSPAEHSWIKLSARPGQSLAGLGKIVEGSTGGDFVTELECTDRDDVVFGRDGNDDLGAGLGDDLILGGRGNDILQGGWGRDRLYGGGASDILFGGVGDDDLWGGGGADFFCFRYIDTPFGYEEFGNDTVSDFKLGVDHLAFANLTILDLDLSADADGNAVIMFDNGSAYTQSVTLLGVAAGTVTLEQLLV
jgi:Ca2+-binding RTX toxin-like protein